MALVAPPANDRKRVKVYELKNNDWFDRGTGFCRGIVVSAPPPTACDAAHARDGRMASRTAIVALGSADLCDNRQRRRKSSSCPRTTSRASCWRRASPKTTATRNSKVGRATLEARARMLTGDRHVDSMDGAEWHRHGPQLSGARGLRQYMVRRPVCSLTETC
jgi:hypothetical protein